jgi:hypothetical protein
MQLGPLETVADCQDALRLLAKTCAARDDIAGAIRAVKEIQSGILKGKELELRGANLGGDRDVMITFSDLKPELRKAEKRAADLEARVKELEARLTLVPQPPTPGEPRSLN